MSDFTLNGRTYSLAEDRRAFVEAVERAVGDDEGLVGTSLLSRKFLAEAKAPAVDVEARTIRQIISSGRKDRDGDTVSPTGWDFAQWKQNPVVLFGHNPFDLPVGRGIGRKVWREGELIWSLAEFAAAEDNPFADQVFRLSANGFLPAASVGFMPTQASPIDPEEGFWGGINFEKQELVEWSKVPVPSNPDALQRAISQGVADPAVLAKMGFEIKRERIEVKEVDPGLAQTDPHDAPGLSMTARVIRAAKAGDLTAVERYMGDLAAVVSGLDATNKEYAAAIRARGAAVDQEPTLVPEPPAPSATDEGHAEAVQPSPEAKSGLTTTQIADLAAKAAVAAVRAALAPLQP